MHLKNANSLLYLFLAFFVLMEHIGTGTYPTLNLHLLIDGLDLVDSLVHQHH